VEYAGGFRLACDPKSLLYLFGMSLDYSDALIGGGFSFRWGLIMYWDMYKLPLL
jgi:iron-sulfur cluster assembly protein